MKAEKTVDNVVRIRPEPVPETKTPPWFGVPFVSEAGSLDVRPDPAIESLRASARSGAVACIYTQVDVDTLLATVREWERDAIVRLLRQLVAAAANPAIAALIERIAVQIEQGAHQRAPQLAPEVVGDEEPGRPA